jgi:tetratricopeptide (TPR) repeat protein
MSGGRERLAGVIGVVAGLALAAGVLRASESQYRPEPSPKRLLYLRSGDSARRAMLTFDALAADIYWIRAIQHYGRDKKSDRVEGRFELLQPLLDLTTTLDPHFNIAYRFGAIFLSFVPPNGPGRSDQAIELLMKGLRHNPERWQFAYDIGFVHYFSTKDYAEAARWFNRAADMPHAPGWVRSLAARTSIEGGDVDGADALFAELASSSEAAIRQVGERGRLQIRALRAIDQLNGMVAKFHEDTGRYPAGWDDLIRAGRLPGIPHDETGSPFFYDAPKHTVVLSPSSTLAPLPKLSRQ